MRWIKGMIIGCLWLSAASVSAFDGDVVPDAKLPAPKVIVVRDDRPPPYHPTAAQADLLRAMDARGKDPDALARCLNYPDPPGTHWNHEAVTALCRFKFVPVLTLDQLQDRLASDGPAALDHYFDGLRKEHSGNDASWKLDRAMEDAFGCACKKARDVADAWKAKAPDSMWAYAASGIAYSESAAVVRGTDSFKATPPENVARMEELDRRAEGDLQQALRRDPHATPAMVDMITLYRREGRTQEATDLLKVGLREHPDNMMLHMAASFVADPKWGGSESELEQERARAVAASTTAPLLLVVVSQIDGIKRGCDCDWTFDDYKAMNQLTPSLSVLRGAAVKANEAGDFADAAIYASELFRFSNTPEVATHVQRGFARKDMNDIDGALADGETALAFRPDYRPALGMMRMLSYMKK